MNHLTFVLQSSLTLPVKLPPPDASAVLVGLLGLLPLAGGYLLARESKGNLLFEVGAVVLLVLATVVPFDLTRSSDWMLVLKDFLARWPVMLFLLGLAFVRDGNYRIVIGVVLMAVSGLVLVPH